MAKQSKAIVFTGGGSTGHVSVNLELIPYFSMIGFTFIDDSL